MHSNILLAFQNLEATYPQHKCFPENSTWARFSSCFSPRSSQSPALQEYFFLLSFLSILEVHVHLSPPTQEGQACLEHLLGSSNFCRILTLETVSSLGLPWGALPCASCRGLCGGRWSAPCTSACPRSCLTSSVPPLLNVCHLVLGRAGILFWGLFR